MLFIISAPDKEVNGLQDHLKIKGFASATFDNVFECKKENFLVPPRPVRKYMLRHFNIFYYFSSIVLLACLYA